MTALDGVGQPRALLSYKKFEHEELELLADRSFSRDFVD
jgi:hypothetical protein